jgi:hypothetical protein
VALTIDSARNIFPQTRTADTVPALVARFNQLSVEDQLALIWFAYKEMGSQITPAALGAARMQFAEPTLNQVRSMSAEEQTKVMFDLASRTDTPINRVYAAWSVNIKLGFWYKLGEWMEEGIVAPIPENYQLSANASAVLSGIRESEAGQQISILRNCVVDMGYDPAKIENMVRVAEPLVAPTEESERTSVTIEGVDNPTVINYMNLLNANDFDNLIELFLPDGALQPPFQKPIIGRDKVLAFFREDCQNLNLIPSTGVTEPADDGFTQIKVTGKVQTPWFGANVGMNVAWRFLLDPNGKIFFVAIDLLASPKELLNLAR